MSDVQMIALLAAPSVIALFLLFYVSYRFMRLNDRLDMIEELLIDLCKTANPATFDELTHRAKVTNASLRDIYAAVKDGAHSPSPAP